jgi:hypothetical protein
MKAKRRRDEGDFEGILNPQPFRKNFSMVSPGRIESAADGSVRLLG